MSIIKEISSDNFDSEVKQSEIPVLMEFHSPGCQPCKRLQVVLEEYGKEMEGKLIIAGMDVSENIDIAGQYGIMAAPTMILFKGGESKWQYSGFLAKNKIKAKIEPLL